MGQQALENLTVAMESLVQFDDRKVKYVDEHEAVVDELNEDITLYLTHISERGLSTVCLLYTSRCV